MGSDHSAIYCGLRLQSPMLFACPPNELNDQGQPKSYQLKIDDMKIVKKSPYHSGSSYSETPLKTKICFPAPFEIENFKYKYHKPFHYTILQQDLDMYHYILRQIDAESKRRLARQKHKPDPPKTHPLITPQISGKTLTDPCVMDMLDIDVSDDGCGDVVLANTENENNNRRAQSLASKPQMHKTPQIDVSDAQTRRDSAPATKERQRPSDYIFRSERSMQQQQQHQEDGNSNNNGEFTFSFDYNKNHTFKLSPVKEPDIMDPLQHTTANANATNREGIESVDDLDAMDLLQLGDYKGLTRKVSDPTPTSKSKEDRKKSLNKSIVSDNYFDTMLRDEDVNDTVAAMDTEIEMDEDSLPRTRSKSMGSYTDHNDNYKPSKKSKISSNTKDDSKSGVNLDQMAKNEVLSPIYKDLAAFSKKLTLVSFGPSRRPTTGNIHCVFKVETSDLKGQCCIALDWNQFAKNVQHTQTAELFHHGIPLYDKTGSPILLKVRYKLSLIDKQILFDYH
eukprot:237612_1